MAKSSHVCPSTQTVTDDSVQGYGMTETNAYVCSVAGVDYLERVCFAKAALKLISSPKVLVHQSQSAIYVSSIRQQRSLCQVVNRVCSW
jgi:hypothetical protein